ncbi:MULTISPECIES: DMT family transporter [unclassified Rhizobium]|uniref:DMT family transporter n=1 Tax=unclassified Rhizobium TaxID=2613769 RepID=UPI00071573D6|nr:MULTISPECIES: DMT family transporter [unclassified Rhizobium]KQS88612.1 hypothetical protein ASG42_15520 [Rhizobium sp. Leaf391]KQT05555.1 hypothetical protein ASG50_14375 [Rhizobium sp. Leaf386]KQT91280.1 hypothetical protein ASG68_19425 [Rhizobium sp. Leaf453]
MSDISVSKTADNRSALICLVLGGMAISGSPIFVRLSEVGPLATAFWRVGIAFVALFIVSLIRRDNGPKPQTLRDGVLLALPGVMLAINLVCWHLSLHITSVANSTLLANLAPVFVTIFGWLLFRLPITRAFLAGLALAAIGIVVLKGGFAAIGGGVLHGDGIAVLSAVFYAGYILVVGRLRSRFDTLRIMVWSSAAAALTMLPLALIFEPVLAPVTAYGWAIVFGLALISHASGQVLITYALAYLPAAFSSLTLLLQPIGAAALGWVVLGEPVSLMQAIGGLIVLSGIMVARRG